MNRLKKYLLIFAMVVCAAFGVLAAACNGGGIKISFETNGAPAIESVSPGKGEVYELPVPEWEGYAFDGWYADRDFTGDAVTSFTVEKSAKFYAKWTKLSKITLDLDGGSLAEGTTLYLKPGENVYNFVKDLTPEKAESQFGAWYYNDAELTRTLTMPEEDITLTARFKTKYTVEIYLQKLSQDGYERQMQTVGGKEEIKDEIGYAYAGEEIEPEPEIQGFEIVENADSIAKGRISETASQNVFRLYYDRLTYQVVFTDSTFGGGSQSQNYLFGTEIEIPAGMFPAQENYLFVGWDSAALEGPIYIAPETVNGTAESEKQTVTVQGNLSFAAIWEEGYTDKFGGEDLIFIIGEQPTAYLSRAGLLFEGTYTPANGEFRFLGENNRMRARGKAFSDKTYVFYDEERQNYTRSLYVPGMGINEDVRILSDSYNGITYIDQTAGTAFVSSTGTYNFADNGDMIASFETGTLAGETLVIRTMQVEVGGTTASVFLVRNEEEYGWGQMSRNVVTRQGPTAYPDNYFLTLDGFGGATYVANGTSSTYTYLRNGDVITIRTSSGSTWGVIRHLVRGSTHLYTVYTDDYDHTYTAAEGRGTLELDGAFRAVYTDGTGIRTEGYFSLYDDSVFGDIMIFISGTGSAVKQRLFLVNEIAPSVGTDDSGSVETQYVFTEKPLGYSEYFYCDTAARNAPLIVFDADLSTQGKITVYGYASGTYEKALLGTYVEESGIYSFTVTDYFDYSDEVSAEPFDYKDIQGFVFATDVLVSTSLFGGTFADPVAYFYSVTTKSGGTLNMRGTEYRYAAQSGEETLLIVGPFCIYTRADGTATVGQYSLSGARLTVQPYSSSNAYYFEIDETEKTFVPLTGLLGTAYKYDATTGSSVSSESLAFDGKGGVTYTYTEETDGESLTYTVQGTYEQSGTSSAGGRAIYLFHAAEGNEKDFRFLLIASSSSTLFLPEIPDYSGEYVNQTELGPEELVLDGFGQYARYTDDMGTQYAGVYLVTGKNAIELMFTLGQSQYLIHFDLKEGRSFTVRGGEAGTYGVIDNNGLTDLRLDFDGYKNVRVYTVSGGEETEIDAEGTYEYEAGTLAVHYKNGAEDVTLRGARGTATVGGVTGLAFFVEHREVSTTYINEADWTVLSLDAYGGAVLHKQNGTREEGRYHLITESLMYYTSRDGSNDCLYRYNKGTGRIEQIVYTERGYYTADLGALLFDGGGFMIRGGETLYYYEIDASENVILYHQDATSDKANVYGFVVEDTFGKFRDEIEFEGETYYASGEFSLRFVRDEATAGQYPVQTDTDEDQNPVYSCLEQLTFAPTGSDEFTVRASVVLGGQSMSCYVQRVVGEDGTATLSVVIGNFIWDIKVNYAGVKDGTKNTYTVLAMRNEQTFLPSVYLYNYLMFAMFYGQTIGNVFGQVSFITEFNEEGIAGDSYVNGAFGQAMGMVDEQGDLVSFERAAYTEDRNGFVIEYTDSAETLYRVHIRLTNQWANFFGLISFDLISFSKVETFVTEDGYTVEIERVLASDSSRPGAFYTVSLTKDEKTIETDSIYIFNNVAYYIVTEQQDGAEKITYYLIRFTVDDTAESGALTPYTSASVEVKEVTRHYGENSRTYADITADGEVLMFAINNTLYIATETTYNEAENTYTVTAHNERQYTVRLDEEGKVTIELVPEEPAPEEGENA